MVMSLKPALQQFDAEEPVIAAMQQGDAFAFREFVLRHHGWVCGVIFSVLGDRDRVEDVAQQVWANAWERMGTLRERDRWKPWLYRIARNAAIDAGREVSRKKKLSGDALKLAEQQGAHGDGYQPERVASQQETKAAVMEALLALPVMYREPLVLRHLHGWSYAEIADVMAMPVDTVETRLVRGRRLLRDALAQCGVLND